jgi:hypothetical protein
MSYSFSILAAEKASAASNVAGELDKVVAQQPIHEADRPAHEAAVRALIELLGEPGEGQEIAGSVTGSIYRTGEGGFAGASLNVNVSIRTKTA